MAEGQQLSLVAECYHILSFRLQRTSLYVGICLVDLKEVAVYKCAELKWKVRVYLKVLDLSAARGVNWV